MDKNIKFRRKDKLFINDIRGNFFRIIKKYSLINKNDSILVGLSGGKDSMTLLKLLCEYKKYLFGEFRIEPLYVHFNNLNYSIDLEGIRGFCKGLELELKVKDIRLIDKRDGKNMCYICSRVKRKNLFDYAREHGFGKIFLGHTMDDAVETLLMNQFYHGKFSSLPVSLDLFGGEVKLLRPLVFFKEEDIIRYAELYEFPKILKDCGYEKVTNRQVFKDLVEEFMRRNPAVMQNIFNSMFNIQGEYLIEK